MILAVRKNIGAAKKEAKIYCERYNIHMYVKLVEYRNGGIEYWVVTGDEFIIQPPENSHFCKYTVLAKPPINNEFGWIKLHRSIIAHWIWQDEENARKL
jgi:hypothetical protein